VVQSKGPRLDGRNGRIWGRYLAGWSQARIAEEFSLSQQHVSDILREVRASIPPEERQNLVTTEVERLDRALAEAVAVLERDHYIVNSGNLVAGPDGELLLDDGPKLAALDRMLKVSAERRKLLGLDAPTEVTATVNTAEPEILRRLRERSSRHTED
jgi:transcriptional regulator with XRE-family HTH domain